MTAQAGWVGLSDELAARLRHLRTQAGLSGKDLAAQVGWQPSKVSRIENAKQQPSPADLTAWAAACRAAHQTDSLLHLLADVQTKHHDWRRRMRRGQTAVQATYNHLVAGSAHIRHFETVYVPGMLQTVEYARRVLAEQVQLHQLDTVDIDTALSTRMQRQQFIYHPGKSFQFLLAEPVLRWQLCPPAAMRAQLDRLLTASDLPNVRLGILPMSTPLAVTPQNSFQLYDNLAITETFLEETTYRGERAARYATILDRLWQQTTEGDHARRLIRQAIDNLSG